MNSYSTEYKRWLESPALTEDERAEQTALRREYLEEFRRQLRAEPAKEEKK